MPSCVAFCGQGSQNVGMGRDLCENFPEAKEVFECGSDVLGVDLKALCFASDSETLSKTENAQLAIFTHSMAGYNVVLRELEVEPKALIGHSLGEYGAMTAAGIITLEDGFRIVSARGKAMAKAAAECGGAMYAVIGSNEETVTNVCSETEGYVLPVNFNSLKQTVIAGEAAAAEAVANKFEALGVRVQRLAVSGAFHTSLMQPAADEFKGLVSEIKFNPVPKVAFFSNITGGRVERVENLVDYLCRHMVSPVLFTKELEGASMIGCGRFIEVGPGKVLSGLIKRTLSNVIITNIEDKKSVQRAREALGLPICQ